MTDIPKSPEDCVSMAEVRLGVDALDQQLVALLETRFGYMRAAARIKETRSAVRDEERKKAVIRAASEAAAATGMPKEAIADIWDRLVEASIAYEMVEWDKIRS